jgi:signal transduction histidine kinase
MDRLQRLLDAGRALVAELDLDAVLDHLLGTAMEITGAQYAALGILDEDRTSLENFITRGVDEETHRAIGDLPRGRGVLGLLIDEPAPLRLPDVTRHPQSYGFPPGHPPMTTFLGVPVVIRGQAWGNLYLTEKHGGGEFDDGDEHSAMTLAAWAGIAIENAHLYERAERRRDELERAVRGLEATTTIARAIGGETRLDRVLELIVKRGRALIDARRVVIALIEGDELHVAARAGADSDAPLPRDVLERVARTTRPARREDALLVPLAFRGRSMGVLAAFDPIGEERGFTSDDEQLLVSFAASAATAVSTAKSVERDRLRHALQAAEEERRRWARELHDETLQGLGGLRVSLAAAARESDVEVLRGHVRAAVEQLQNEIANLRSIITDLRPAALDQLGLEPALEALIQRVASIEGLEIETDLRLEPLDPDVETTVYRLVQEALTNVSRHARATRVTVSVRLEGSRVALTVTDDGEGFDPDAAVAGFGVQGMRERVALAGGTLEIDSGAGGTRIAVSLPAGYAEPPASTTPLSSA